MDDRNEKVSDSVERDIQGAVKMGADAARTAKTLGKAAAHAAAGDVAGAAAEVVKDPETLKKILLILLIPVISFVLITTMFLYALPTIPFEAQPRSVVLIHQFRATLCFFQRLVI